MIVQSLPFIFHSILLTSAYTKMEYVEINAGLFVVCCLLLYVFLFCLLD
jgi:hypothetical protein